MLGLAIINCLPRIPLRVWPVIGCIFVLAILFSFFRWLNRGSQSFYFDPQDFVRYENGGGRELPVSASTNVFEPLLRNYIDVTKLLITVAAASIAFGGGQSPPPGIVIAKIILAFSVLYGVMFCALLQYFYDEYCQNVRAYTPFRYSFIEGLGFSALLCLAGGYFTWAFNLG